MSAGIDTQSGDGRVGERREKEVGVEGDTERGRPTNRGDRCCVSGFWF